MRPPTADTGRLSARPLMVWVIAVIFPFKYIYLKG